MLLGDSTTSSQRLVETHLPEILPTVGQQLSNILLIRGLLNAGWAVSVPTPFYSRELLSPPGLSGLG